MGTYYSDLERKVRENIPANKYGNLGYLLDPEYGISLENPDSPIFKGNFSFDVGYNCANVAKYIFDEMKIQGRNPVVIKGKDSKNLFKTHFYVMDEDKRIVDGTPLYSFLGENHKHEKKNTKGKFDDKIYVEGPVSLIEKKDKKFLLGLNLYVSDVNDMKNKMMFDLHIKNIETKEEDRYKFQIDLDNYRSKVEKDYTGFTDKTRGYYDMMKIIFDSKNGVMLPEEGEMDTILKDNFYLANAFIHKVAYPVVGAPRITIKKKIKRDNDTYGDINSALGKLVELGLIK